MVDEIVLRCALAKAFLYRPGCANELLEQYGSVGEIFRNRDDEAFDPFRDLLEKAFSSHTLEWAENEVQWCGDKGVEIICYGERRYPQLLLESSSAPNLLYYKGTADLNSPRSISMVGTRLASAYGKEMCSAIVSHIGKYNPLIVSGLAYGIDIACHKAAIEAGLETVAVLPNGIDTIYPARHRDVAAAMVRSGGILTEFPRGTAPQRMNFIKRNRIIAAISQGVVVVESRIKGGSMITVEYANSFNRDVFAVPGRVTDTNSFGCNYLIAKNVAAIYNSSSVIPQSLGWEDIYIPDNQLQPELFSSKVGDKEKILLSLKFDKPTDVERICLLSGHDWATVSMLLLELELEGKIKVSNNTDYYLSR